MNATILAYLLKFVKVMALLPAMLELGWRVLSAIVRLVCLWKKPGKVKPMPIQENTMFKLTDTEEVVLTALSESEDWITVLEKIENIVIENLKTKDLWYIELINIGGDILAQCTGDIMTAIEGCTNIPAEWKVSTMQDKINFILKVLISQGKLVAGIFLPKPETPVE